MPEIKEDLDLVVYFVKNAQKEKYFGDISISFRAGQLTYFRKNYVRTKDELILEINDTGKVITNIKK